MSGSAGSPNSSRSESPTPPQCSDTTHIGSPWYSAHHTYSPTHSTRSSATTAHQSLSCQESVRLHYCLNSPPTHSLATPLDTVPTPLETLPDLLTPAPELESASGQYSPALQPVGQLHSLALVPQFQPPESPLVPQSAPPAPAQLPAYQFVVTLPPLSVQPP